MDTLKAEIDGVYWPTQGHAGGNHDLVDARLRVTLNDEDQLTVSLADSDGNYGLCSFPVATVLQLLAKRYGLSR